MDEEFGISNPIKAILWTTFSKTNYHKTRQGSDTISRWRKGALVKDRFQSHVKWRSVNNILQNLNFSFVHVSVSFNVFCVLV